MGSSWEGLLLFAFWLCCGFGRQMWNRMGWMEFGAWCRGVGIPCSSFFLTWTEKHSHRQSITGKARHTVERDKHVRLKQVLSLPESWSDLHQSHYNFLQRYSGSHMPDRSSHKPLLG